jgi:outer membrane lipoprotein-sorting protein
MAPLQILGGDDQALRDAFVVTSNGEARFTLRPLDEGMAFHSLELSLAGGTLAGLEIDDKLGQQVVIEFFGMDGNAALSPGDFVFIPPEGADLFYYDE